MKFSQKYRELEILKNIVFLVGHFEFFFPKKKFFFASFLLKLVTIYGVPRIFQNFDDYPDFQQKARGYKIMSNTVRSILGAPWSTLGRDLESILHWSFLRNFKREHLANI